MNAYYIGLMSGTSLDGIDAVIVDFNSSPLKIIATHYESFPFSLRENILALCQPGENEINRLGELDVLLGETFAHAVLTLLKKSNIHPNTIQAIGSHGQTIRHLPNQKFTLQIGDPNIIAARTAITTVADFRRRDVAYDGEGAPLVPAFHHALFKTPDKNRVILNVGGIANITLLTDQETFGFDPGPGNILLDAWAKQHINQLHDDKGNWARQGKVNTHLLQAMLADPYFHRAPPKSTGREYFNLNWLSQFHNINIDPVDMQCTLVELTAECITRAIKHYISHGEIIICGGGAHNDFLCERLRKLAAPLTLHSTTEWGIDPNWIEAIAFAWLAKQTLEKKPGNLTAVTGAKKSTILGGVYYA